MRSDRTINYLHGCYNLINSIVSYILRFIEKLRSGFASVLETGERFFILWSTTYFPET